MDKAVIRTGIKNTVYVVLAQSISLILGIARTLILPILLGITNFGYWQVYLLYMSYVGIFALGFNDGIYLKYGKYEYNELPKEKLRSSIRLFIFFQLIIMIIISAIIAFEKDPAKKNAMFWASVNIPIAGLTGVLTYIFQITNQLKKYSFYTVLDKIVVLLIIVVLYIFKMDNFIIIVIADTLTRVLVLVLMVVSCRDIIFGKGIEYQYALNEVVENIRIGIKLMFANFSGMLVLGFGRFLLERTATVEEYGTYSFAMSTMNLVLVLITAIGLVIYPTLSRVNENVLSNFFNKMNDFLVVIIFGLLTILFPLKYFISSFMINYIGIFKYLAIVFAIIFVQSKMQILINPYYKLLRKEDLMLRANIVGVIMAVVFVTPLYFLTGSVRMVAIGTLLAMLIRLYLSEVYLRRELNILESKTIFLELLGLLLFIILGSMSNIIISLITYLLIYSVLVMKRSKKIKSMTKYLIRK